MKKDSILFCMMHSEQNPQNIYYCGLQEIVAVEMEKIVDDTTMRLIDQTYETGEAGVLYALTHSNKFPEDMYAVILGYGGVARGAIATCEKLGMKVSIIRRTHHEVLPNFVKKADILINALAWPQTFRDGKYHLVRREDIQNAKENLVVLDLAVDIPGPIETVTHHTTYENPFYYEEDRTHIAIYGYPGLFPLSSSVKYSKQVLPIALTIANNNGLAEIHKIEELGPYIHNAILDPKAYHWEDYKPVGYNDIVALE